MCSPFFCWCTPLIRHEYFHTECKHHTAKSNPGILRIENNGINQWQSLCGTVTNNSLQNSVVAIHPSSSPRSTTQLAFVCGKNKIMKETILDSQSRSMRDSLIFNGIPKLPRDEPKKAVKDFMIKHCKLPTETINSITFQHVPFGQNTHQHHSTLADCQTWTFQTERTGKTARQTAERNALWIQWSVSTKKSSTDTNSSFPSTNTW